MPSMLHGVVVKIPCVMYMVAGEDVINGPRAHERSLRETMRVRSSLLEIRRENIANVLDDTEKVQEEMRE